MRAVELSTLVMSSSLGLHKSGHIRVVIGMLQHRTYLVGRMLLVWFGVAQKLQQTKMLVTHQRFGVLLLFELVWQYYSLHTKYNKGRFKVMTTYLQQ